MRKFTLGAARLAVFVVVVLTLDVAGGPTQAADRHRSGRPDGPVLLTPDRGTTVTSGFFGVHAPALVDAFPRAPVGAVNLMTDGVYWPRLETSPGVFDFTRLDALVAQAEANGAKPLLVLGQTPWFHSTDPSSGRIVATVPDLDAWRSYVTRVVTQYGDRLNYQVWPEPNVKINWEGTPYQMAELVAAASQIIHGFAPRAVVVGPAMVVRLRYERVFMRLFYGLKVGGVMVGSLVDAVGIDPYALENGAPEDSLALISQAQRILAKDGVTAPLWSMEINYGVPIGGVGVAVHSSGAQQASDVARTYLLNAGAGVGRIYWLGWARYLRLDVQLVDEDLVTPSSAGLAYALLHRWLLGQHARGCSFHHHRSFYSCTFVRSGRSSTAFWTRAGHARVLAPAGARHVQKATGQTRSTRPGERIRVGVVPVWVTH